VGLEEGFPLIGYRSVAKNLELTADNAEDIAEIVMEAEGHTLDVDSATMRQIREFTDQIDELTALAVRAVVERDYDLTVECRDLFSRLEDREQEILDELPNDLDNETLLMTREVLVSLQHTAEYAMRNAEIAANLALNEASEHVEII
jgi:Na+/phosphate symporter